MRLLHLFSSFLIKTNWTLRKLLIRLIRISLISFSQIKGSGIEWRRWTQGCISSPNFSIIVNGKPLGMILATKGLRQGGPISSLFLSWAVLVVYYPKSKARFWSKILLLERVNTPHLLPIFNLQMIPSCFHRLKTCMQPIIHLKKHQRLEHQCQRSEILGINMEGLWRFIYSGHLDETKWSFLSEKVG